MVDDHNREVTFPGPWLSMEEFKDANEAAGYFFFSPATMKAFSSRVSEDLYGGRLFVTSERSRYSNLPRRYTIRVARDDGTVGRLGEHGQYATRSGAHWAAKEIAREEAALALEKEA